ncbi:MAG: Outer membrane protein assembly factor BamD [Chlamydiae bacterium]|nr:Outer membrane protein assembly factor BamD [Chlamydiota bacterium]
MRKYVILFLIPAICSFADYTLKDGKLVEREEIATESVQEHYSTVTKYFEKGEWKNLEKEAIILIKNFPNSPFARDATFFLGMAYFKQDDFEMANIEFTEYLTRQATPKYFEETIQYKFEIAEKFRSGARKHIMGFKTLPKWMPAGSEAIAIYDEVISALPHHELAAHSHYGKAQVQAKNEDFRAAVESYQTLIRRFPKHPLAIESYIGIGEVYLQQSQSEYCDPDFLDLAELNLRKFRTSFPGEEKIAVAQGNYMRMQDHYAGSLFETARFYERTNKWGAAKIYYAKILKNYPDSFVAKKSKDRLEIVESKLSYLETKKAKK